MSTINNEESRVSRRSSKKKKKKSKLKGFLLFTCVGIIFTAITFPLYIFYGPFKDVRDLLVGISMSTGNYQFVAKMFFSDEKIAEILNAQGEEANNNVKLFTSVQEQDYEDEGDEDIIRKDISDSKYDGIALIIKDPTRVKVGYSSRIGEVGETVSDMAAKYGAVAAVNGGGYLDVSSDGNGGIPLGILISDGEVINPKDESEYYISNKEHKPVVFSINSNGELFVGQASVSDLLEMDSQQAISFEPTLVVDGEPYISQTTLHGLNPRTAIGQRADGSIILLVIDGRQGLKLGATLQDVQSIMLQLGAVNAMCLDGGGSTAMYYNGEIINNPSNLTGERCVPDIIYVK